MLFCNTTSTYKKNVFLALFLVLASFQMLIAQAFSPFSAFGVGNSFDNTFSSNQGMAGIAAGYRGSRDINYRNPASYSAIRFTTFDFGMRMEANVISDSISKVSVGNLGINHLTMAFPLINNVWSASFGLLPYTYKNYKLNTEVSENGVNYDFFRRGKGSTYQFFIGNGFQIKNFSFGANVGFVFGKLEDFEEIVFNDSIRRVNTAKHSNIALHDFVFNFGVQYQVKLNKLENENRDRQAIFMTIGLYGQPPLNLRASKSLYATSTFENILTGEQTDIDTASNGLFKDKVKLKNPFFIAGGLSFGNEHTWTIGTDIYYRNSAKEGNDIQGTPLNDEFKFQLGGQIIPNFKSKKFLSNVSYRLGFYVGKSKVVVDNQSVNQVGTTFGFGFPLGKKSKMYRAFSYINLNFDIGRTGNKSIKENYYKLTLAYQFSDKWFIKRKFD